MDKNSNQQCAGKYSAFSCRLGDCSVYPSCTNPLKNPPVKVKRKRKSK